MGDLLVHHEAVLHGVWIRGVLDGGPGTPVYVAYGARQAEWFSPDDPAADDDGWVRGLDENSITGELELCFTSEAARERALAQLHRWQQQPPPRLDGVCSLLYQYVGLIDRDSGVSVGVKMSCEDQDQP